MKRSESIEDHYSRVQEAPSALLKTRLTSEAFADLHDQIQKELSRRAGLQKDCRAIRQKRASDRVAKQQETARQQLIHSGDPRQIKF